MENTWDFLEHSGNRPSGSSNMAMEKSPFSSMIFPAINLRLVRGFPRHVWLPQGIRQHSTIIYIYKIIYIYMYNNTYIYIYIVIIITIITIIIIVIIIIYIIYIYNIYICTCHKKIPSYFHYIHHFFQWKPNLHDTKRGLPRRKSIVSPLHYTICHHYCPTTPHSRNVYNGSVRKTYPHDIPIISSLLCHYTTYGGNSMGYGWHIMVGMTLMRIHGTVKVCYH